MLDKRPIFYSSFLAAALAFATSGCGGQSEDDRSIAIMNGGGVSVSGSGGSYASGGAEPIASGGSQSTSTIVSDGATSYCGNGIIETNLGEECDDGNLTRGDGCSDTCQEESPYCPPSGCNPQTVICGDSILGPGEMCDDGNVFDNDGCSSSCLVESGYTCPVAGQACQLQNP